MTKQKVLLWGFIGFYVILFSLISVLKYFSYSFHDFDLAVYAQGLWNFLHGSFQSSILGIPLLGNHFVPILFLITPLYAVLPSPLTLLVLQTLFLGGGAFFVHRIARRKFPETVALTFAFSYLIYPALGYTNLFEFHPVAFAVFLLLGALDAFEEGRFGRFLLFLVFASLCQEDVSLAAIAIGFYALFTKRSWKWVCCPLVWGTVYFGGVVFWLMPLLNPETINFSLLYSHLGASLPKALLFLITHPPEGAALLLEGPHKRNFILQLLLPLAFFPLLDPKSFFLSIPFFLEQLLSRRSTQHVLVFHYGALFIPLLYYSAVQGSARLLRWRKNLVSPAFLFFPLFFAPLLTNLWAGPHLHLAKVFEESRRDFLDEKRDLLLKSVPENGSVMATFEFLPRLARRKELYSFHHVYMRKYTLSEKQYSIPETIQYLLVDFNDPLTHGVFYFSTGEGDRYVREFLEKGPFKVTRSFQDLILFEKGEGERLFRVEASQETPSLLATDPDQKIGLVRWRVEKIDPESKGVIPLVFDWYCLGASPRRYGLFFEVSDEGKKRVQWSYHSFCYRIYPTERWEKGEKITEKYRLVLPPGEWKVSLYLMDEKERKTLFPFVRLGTLGGAGGTL